MYISSQRREKLSILNWRFWTNSDGDQQAFQLWKQLTVAELKVFQQYIVIQSSELCFQTNSEQK